MKLDLKRILLQNPMRKKSSGKKEKNNSITVTERTELADQMSREQVLKERKERGFKHR